jgi:hypothetical protein
MIFLEWNDCFTLKGRNSYTKKGNDLERSVQRYIKEMKIPKNINVF